MSQETAQKPTWSQNTISGWMERRLDVWCRVEST